MIKQVIETLEAPAAIGVYSQAIKAGNTVYLSGQIPLDPKTALLVTGDFIAQVHQVFANIRAVAEAAGGHLENIVKLTIYLTDLSRFAQLNETMSQYFKLPYPARSTIQVSQLPKAAEIEIDAVMVL